MCVLTFLAGDTVAVNVVEGTISVDESNKTGREIALDVLFLDIGTALVLILILVVDLVLRLLLLVMMVMFLLFSTPL